MAKNPDTKKRGTSSDKEKRVTRARAPSINSRFKKKFLLERKEEKEEYLDKVDLFKRAGATNLDGGTPLNIEVALNGDESRMLDMIAMRAGLTPGEWVAQAITAQLKLHFPKTFPVSPPHGEYYKSRQYRESAPEFIARVYAPFLTGIFTRADLRKIDRDAETALRNWERDHGRRADLNLPTVKERNSRQLAAREGFASADEAQRERERLSSAAARRRRVERNLT